MVRDAVREIVLNLGKADGALPVATVVLLWVVLFRWRPVRRRLDPPVLAEPVGLSSPSVLYVRSNWCASTRVVGNSSRPFPKSFDNSVRRVVYLAESAY